MQLSCVQDNSSQTTLFHSYEDMIPPFRDTLLWQVIKVQNGKFNFSFLPLLQKFNFKVKWSLPSRRKKFIFWLINFGYKGSTRSVAKEPEKWWSVMEKTNKKVSRYLLNILQKLKEDKLSCQSRKRCYLAQKRKRERGELLLWYILEDGQAWLAPVPQNDQ